MDIQVIRVSNHPLRARTEPNGAGYTTVIPYLEGCPVEFRVTVKVRSLKMARRLVRAIEAGKALTDISLQKDLFGDEYLSSTLRVGMNQINADLLRLGF